jgi:thiosulfate/3-mercaptopyruvate sulfurtransferase
MANTPAKNLASPLVSTVWLAQHLNDPNVRLVDIRGRVAPATDPHPHYFSHRAAYDESHIPGAVFIDWVKDITIDGPDKMQIAPPEKFAALMGKIGVGAKTTVVAYDDASGMFAARLWWALNYYGHEKVVVLDGGWQKWLAENRKVTDESPRLPITKFEPKINPTLRRTADDVANLSDQAKLVDVRTTEEYTGKASRAKRFGHIPGAINLPRTNLVGKNGEMLPGGIIEDLLLAADLQPEDEVVLYCNGGVSASYGLLALRVAGYDGGAVYDGSWKDWGNDDQRPIE